MTGFPYSMASERFSFFYRKQRHGRIIFFRNSGKFTVKVRRGQYLSAFIAPVIRALVTEYLFFRIYRVRGERQSWGGETPVELSGLIGHLLKSLKKGGYTIKMSTR